jgi:hypothetical protein
MKLFLTLALSLVSVSLTGAAAVATPNVGDTAVFDVVSVQNGIASTVWIAAASLGLAKFERKNANGNTQRGLLKSAVAGH